jgi:RimJ/RimL family protein N-acetyltransferase
MAVMAPKTIQLKDGIRALLRCAGDSDALALLENAKSGFVDGEGMVVEPDEFTKTEEQEKEWIRGLNENPRNLLLVVEVEGRIVGNIDFHIARRRRVAHWGEFGMSVVPGWRSRGVGDALLGGLVAWATSVPEIEKIVLRVRADNPRAMALYKKHGFVEYGRSKDSVRLSDGVYIDDVMMERFVREGVSGSDHSYP